MQTLINPQRFAGSELALAPLARGQSAAMLAGFRIGRISHAVSRDGQTSWLWSLTGPHCAAALGALLTCGETRSLGEAKIQLRQAFDVWLNWALAQNGPVYWHWTEAGAACGTLAQAASG